MTDQLAYEVEPVSAICHHCLTVLQNPTFSDGRFWYCQACAWAERTEVLAERIRRERWDEDEPLRLRCRRCLSNERDAIPELGELCERCAKG